jgi:NAD(P)-dependent dehydrogenase (short-subunit alcohol dehydrogenase family)
MRDLNNGVWMVTGASAGFGRSLCEEVLARGGRLIATARDPAVLADIVATAPGRALAVKLDLSRPEQIAPAVDTAQRHFGAIDVLVNNAGYGFLAAVEEASDAEVRAQFEVNFFGAASLIRAVMPAMRARRSGTIINISSSAGSRGGAGAAYYSGTKWALEALSESLAAEAGPLGIRVLIVEPGPFRTHFAGRSMVTPEKPIADYAAAAATRAWLVSTDGKQRGDPARAATIIVDTAISADPPLRLVLGKMSFDHVCNALNERLKDTLRSSALAASADFPEGQ